MAATGLLMDPGWKRVSGGNRRTSCLLHAEAARAWNMKRAHPLTQGGASMSIVVVHGHRSQTARYLVDMSLGFR